MEAPSPRLLIVRRTGPARRLLRNDMPMPYTVEADRDRPMGYQTIAKRPRSRCSVPQNRVTGALSPLGGAVHGAAGDVRQFSQSAVLLEAEEDRSFYGLRDPCCGC